jgi:hypothetical protein
MKQNSAPAPRLSLAPEPPSAVRERQPALLRSEPNDTWGEEPTKRITRAPVEEELHPFPSPTAASTLVTEFKSTLLVSSIQSLRERDLFDRYRALLPEAEANAVLSAIVGVWLPLEIATVHYTAVNALGLTYAESARGGTVVGEKIQATLLGTVARLARTTGVTPWTVLAQFQRLFERIFRGGGTRVMKLGPKEARIDIVGLPLAAIPCFRAGFQGMIKSGGELFCTRAYVSDMPRLCTNTTIGFRCAWA